MSGAVPKPNEPIYLVCAPATGRFTARGSVFHHRCSRCERQVMVAPSGQAWLRKYGKTKIQCSYCYEKRPPEDGGLHTLAASVEEILNEMETSVPNLWRKRN